MKSRYALENREIHFVSLVGKYALPAINWVGNNHQVQNVCARVCLTDVQTGLERSSCSAPAPPSSCTPLITQNLDRLTHVLRLSRFIYLTSLFVYVLVLFTASRPQSRKGKRAPLACSSSQLRLPTGVPFDSCRSCSYCNLCRPSTGAAVANGEKW